MTSKSQKFCDITKQCKWKFSHVKKWWNGLGEQEGFQFQHLEVEIWFHDVSVIYLHQTQGPDTDCDTFCSGCLNLLMALSPDGWGVAGCLDSQIHFLFYYRAEHPYPNYKFVTFFFWQQLKLRARVDNTLSNSLTPSGKKTKFAFWSCPVPVEMIKWNRSWKRNDHEGEGAI